MHDKYNIIPMSMAVLLHVSLAASLLLVFDFSPPVVAAPVLVIEATLVSAKTLTATPAPVVELPEPETEPPELSRIEAEERMRLEELAAERQRIDARDTAERERKARQAVERRKREEAELERKRTLAEKKRQEDMERQRKENLRLREATLAREANELRLQEIAAEEKRLLAMNSGAMARYSFALQQKIKRNWVPPASAQPGIECVIDVRQLPGGDVISAMVGRCNGDAAVRRSIEAAVHKASPLPAPENPGLFQRDLRIVFKPEE